MWAINLIDHLRVGLESAQKWIFILSVFAAFPLLAFRKTRLSAGMFLSYGSLFWGVLLWTQAFMYFVAHEAWGWLVFGVLIGIIGIVPLACIYAATHLDWLSFSLVLGSLLWIYGTRYIAARCIGSIS